MHSAALTILLSVASPAAVPIAPALIRPMPSVMSSIAHPIPPLDGIASPAERPVLEDLVTAIRTDRPASPAAALAQFDAALDRLPSPTPFAGRSRWRGL